VAVADGFKDDFIEKSTSETSLTDLAFVKGQINAIDDFIGLGHVLKSYDVVK
jgi:hypothetical protein